jgi:hypothetical protein
LLDLFLQPADCALTELDWAVLNNMAAQFEAAIRDGESSVLSSA